MIQNYNEYKKGEDEFRKKLRLSVKERFELLDEMHRYARYIRKKFPLGKPESDSQHIVRLARILHSVTGSSNKNNKKTR